MRVFLTTLGCKLNQAESDAFARAFAAGGDAVVQTLEEADLHVVHSCTVTHHAARDSRRAARLAQRSGSPARTVLTGCWATASSAEARRIPGVDLVVPNPDKRHLVELVRRRFPELAAEERPAEMPPHQVRSALAIEDGCNMRCGFCVIPATRGRQRSREPDEVVADAMRLYAAGCREVVLTGVQISSYRVSGTSLRDLVVRLLDETPLGRLRLTSIAPWQVDWRLVEAWPPRLCRHLHLSLQSGCDATLRRMRRPYTTAQFAETVARIRRAIPGAAITTDVITGYPGESDRCFEESLAFVAALDLARVHVFTYSERPGTEAAALAEPVPLEVRRERTARMLELARRCERAFHASQAGREAQVLWEDRRDGCRRGTTDNYVRVRGIGDGALPVGELERVRFLASAAGDPVVVPATRGSGARVEGDHQARMLSPAST